MACKVCLNNDEACICPECPNCELKGDPGCYKDHTLLLGKDQLLLRQAARIDTAREALEDAIEEAVRIESEPANYTEEWKDL